MSHSLLFAFVIFAVVMFFTPGPNNIMLLSSGLTYGFRRTVPHIAGITVGFAFMVGAVGLGLGTVFIAYPILQTILKYAGVAYLIYLAAAIAMSGARPFSWRREASVRSPRARDVARMLTPSQPADSITTSVVVSDTPLSSPPMMPPIATGPLASATTSIPGPTFRVCPSRHSSDSPSRASRT